MKKKAIKITAIVLSACILLGSLSAVGFVFAIKQSNAYVTFDKNRLNEVCNTVKILDVNGDEIQQASYFGQNKQIPLAALNKYTYMAFVAVEDKRFFQHNGIDVKRVFGAALNNLKSRSFKEGASTISQQLIKNTHLDNNKNLKRKINEMLLAVELENSYTKQEILEMYLNTIYFGRNAYGIENAANVYFDKSAAQLTVAESATLAAMIKAPNVYAPDKNVEKCKNRRNTVLKLMLEQKIIDNQQYTTAVNSDLSYRPYNNKSEKTYVYQVLEETAKLLNMTPTQLFRSEFVIQTYFDPKVQSALDKYANTDTTQNVDGSLCDLSCVICNNQGGVVACYFRGESALSNKQIGSTAKPIAVYTPALCENLITQASPVLDEPTDFGGYRPTNANGYNGWTTVKNAVTKSLNVPAVKTLNSLGLDTANKYLSKLGFDKQDNLSLALGNVEGGINIHQLANCYATLASGGINNGVRYVKNIYCDRGEIYTRTPSNLRVFDTKSAYLMTDMLQNAAKVGTARAISQANVETAAKTGTVGTSGGNSQALVAGYTTLHTYVFWYSGNLSNSINGGTKPCQMAAKVLKSMYEGQKPQPFSPPNGVFQLAVDKESLYNNQLVQLADNGENFMFADTNLPQEKPKINYSYTLQTVQKDGKFYADLPNVEGMNWLIFRIENDGKVQPVTGQLIGGRYYAELYKNGCKVYTTPQIEISVPITEQQHSKNIWESLFWPTE